MDNITQWCSFCSSEPAIGTLKKVQEDQLITLPACDECARMVLQDPGRSEIPHDQWVDNAPGLW